MTSLPDLFDVGSNLGDPVFRGVYYEKQTHPDDYEDVLERAKGAGVKNQLLTGDCLEGSSSVIRLAREHGGLFATVGCHPCRAQEFETHAGGPEAYLNALASLIEEDLSRPTFEGGGRVLAVGECGLDYDRLELCPKDIQLKYFAPQLQLATRFNLPLFLHSRAAHQDLVETLKSHPNPLRGVVHSHSGTLAEAIELIQMGFYIGIKCSLKTEDNLDCVRNLPLNKLLIESDCPWCEIRPSHASYKLLSGLTKLEEFAHLKSAYMPPSVKKKNWAKGEAVRGRNEPYATGQVAWVLSQLKEVSLEEVASKTNQNARNLFSMKS